MVGIVVVAHSAKLAEAIIELSALMARRHSHIVSAGGTRDPENRFGTDPFEIQKAIESVFSDDGVVVLMDMGSAILSAETALEFLKEEQRSRVRLCEAPLVEGTIAAAARAEAGGTLEEVMDEARGALAAKSAQLKPAKSSPELSYTRQDGPDSKEIVLAVKNRLGIHARPAARFVSLANQFKSDINIRNITKNTRSANAKSINSVFTLGILRDHEILITAAGPDSGEALAALKSLVEAGFGEGDEKVDSKSSKILSKENQIENKLIGIPISPGIAVGPIIRYRLSTPQTVKRAPHKPEVEWQRFCEALRLVREEIAETRNSVVSRMGRYQAEIFDSHILCLDDPAIIESVKRKIFSLRQRAENAWTSTIDDVIVSYRSLENSYLRSRSADLVDLKTKVEQKLAGKVQLSLHLVKPAILVADDLSPFDIARLDAGKLLAICISSGSSNSHSAILAKALGIPVVFGLGAKITALAEQTIIAVDGYEGSAVIGPDKPEEHKKRQREWRRRQKAEQKAGQGPAITVDGKHIEVTANAASATEARRAILYGAEGIGLLRTEFLFLDRADAPSEDEQLFIYRNIAEATGQYPLTIRTLDAGADKVILYLNQRSENNPFLGERGIRLSLNHPDIFKTQLRAILRACQRDNIRIVLPMVSTVNEIWQAKNILSEAEEELNLTIPSFRPELGIMIETPSSAIMAANLAKEVAFFSIGTNDLTQYVMAVDRNDAGLQSLGDAFQPAVLRLIRQTLKAAKKTGIPVAVCGEMASQKLALPLLIGAGVYNLSVDLSAIADVKRTISRLKLSEAEKIADQALEFDTAEEVKRYLAERS